MLKSNAFTASDKSQSTSSSFGFSATVKFSSLKIMPKECFLRAMSSGNNELSLTATSSKYGISFCFTSSGSNRGSFCMRRCVGRMTRSSLAALVKYIEFKINNFSFLRGENDQVIACRIGQIHQIEIKSFFSGEGRIFFSFLLRKCQRTAVAMMPVGNDDLLGAQDGHKFFNHLRIVNHAEHIAHPLIIGYLAERRGGGIVHVRLQFERGVCI